MNTIAIMMFITAAYLLFNAVAMSTKNRVSFWWFKIIPFALGLFCLFNGLYLVGIIRFN